MKYYKIIKDKELIGVITSEYFRYCNPINGFLFNSNETEGQFVEYKSELYRDYWMSELPEKEFSYIQAVILEINIAEYQLLSELKEKNEILPAVEEPEEIIEPAPIVDEYAEITLEQAKAQLLLFINKYCQKVIEQGFDITLSDNVVHHFSLTTQDQLNLITLSSLADSQEYIPYHADGELCKFYSAAEIKQIIAMATQFKMYHTTYYNALKAYINSITNLEELSNIEYGMELPEEYQSDVLKAIM